MDKQKPIFKQLFTKFSCFALIPVIFIGVLSLFVSSRILYRNLQYSISDSLKQTSLIIDDRMKEMRYLSDHITANSQLKRLLRQPISDENILLLHEELDKSNSKNMDKGYTVTLLGKNGQIYTNWNTDGMIYRNDFITKIKQNSWHQQLENGETHLTWIPYMDNPAGYDMSGKVVTLARSIINDSLEGEAVLGTVMISVPVDKVFSALDGGSGRILVMDEKGVIAMSRTEEEIGTTLSGFSLLEGNQSMQKIRFDGVSYLGSAGKLDTWDLYILSLVPYEGLQRQIITSIMLICISIGLSIVIIFFVAYRVSKSLASPILVLEDTMRQAQSGQLQLADIHTEISEIGSLTENYNRMVNTIQCLIEETIAQEQRRKEIEVEKANAELKFLRAQITPHFLFNTLNSIKWLAVIHGVKPVEEMITALGRLLECSMQKGNDMIPMREELENVKAYLKIQGMRYGDRLKVDYAIEEKILENSVPKLVLQPLVENAIIHGTDKNQNGGTITIRAYDRDGTIVVEVEDNGPGICGQPTAEAEGDSGEEGQRLSGIGIKNVNKRVKLIYGEEYGLSYTVGKDNRGTVAILVLKGEEINAEGDIGG